MTETSKVISPAEKRARAYAALAPTGTKVTVTVEPWDMCGQQRFIAQVIVEGSIDRIIATVSSAATGRTRLDAERMFLTGNHPRKVKVRDLSYAIRHVYVDHR